MVPGRRREGGKWGNGPQVKKFSAGIIHDRDGQPYHLLALFMMGKLLNLLMKIFLDILI